MHLFTYTPICFAFGMNVALYHEEHMTFVLLDWFIVFSCFLVSKGIL